MLVTFFEHLILLYFQPKAISLIEQSLPTPTILIVTKPIQTAKGPTQIEKPYRTDTTN